MRVKRPHLKVDQCAADGCTEPRLYIGSGDRGWYSSLCRAHDNERHKLNRQERKANGLTPPLTKPPGTFVELASAVFDAWEHDRWLGIVRYGKKRVFALKPVGNGYRATVTGSPSGTSLESVYLEADTPLSVWGRE